MKTPRLFIICWLLAGILALFDAAWVQAQTTDPAHLEVRRWIEKSIPLYMEEARMPGFSIAVVDDGETIYAEGFGLRDTQKNLPATPDTLYGIGSITKSFVAIGIMQLVEAGKINLDDPVSNHIPFELGMQRTTLSLAAFQSDPDHILPHFKLGDSVQPSRFPYPNPDDNPEFSFITAAGGIGRYCYHKVD